jgi:hypothetical protein
LKKLPEELIPRKLLLLFLLLRLRVLLLLLLPVLLGCRSCCWCGCCWCGGVKA